MQGRKAERCVHYCIFISYQPSPSAKTKKLLRHEESSYRLTVEPITQSCYTEKKEKKTAKFFIFKLRNKSNISLLLSCISAPTSACRSGIAVVWWVLEASNIGAVGVILAQHLVLFREERLTLQVGAADLKQKHIVNVFGAHSFTSGALGLEHRETSSYSADEAGVVPLGAQGLQELVTGLNREVAAVAVGPEHGIIVCEKRGRFDNIATSSSFLASTFQKSMAFSPKRNQTKTAQHDVKSHISQVISNTLIHMLDKNAYFCPPSMLKVKYISFIRKLQTAG